MKSIKYIPFGYIHPEMKQEMLVEFERFYDEQKYILGPGLEKFEKEYAAFNEVKYAIGVGNGHDALLIILKCLEIGPCDEVILPAQTFIATALSVVNVGAKPILVDIDEHTYTLNPHLIEEKVTEKTKAIVPVHLYGNPADVIAIDEIARKYQTHLIEDNAQAHGATIQDKKTGSFGVMNFTSFYPTKNLGALGDGGVITTNNEELAKKARAYRNYGKSESGEYNLVGINSRLDELQARLLSLKLKHLDKWNKERIGIAEWYESGLKDNDHIQLQNSIKDTTNIRHIFPILSPERNELRKYLSKNGIETLIHYEKPIHLHPAFSIFGHQPGDFPISEKVCSEELSLPIYPGLEQHDVEYICDKINSFFR